HPVGSRDACHRRAFGQRLFDDSPFLCDAPPLPLDRTRQLTLRRVLSWNLSGSVHLCSKWTPILSVHFGEWLSFRWLSRRSQPDAYVLSAVVPTAVAAFTGLAIVAFVKYKTRRVAVVIAYVVLLFMLMTFSPAGVSDMY